MAKGIIGGIYQERTRKKRPGVHAKTKHSKHKSSRNYRKPYKKQDK